RLGTGDPTSAKISIRAGHIFNNDGLAEDTAHVLGDDARDHIRWSARARWHDDGNRPSRIGLRPYHPRSGRDGGGARCGLKKPAAWKSQHGGTVDVPRARILETVACLPANATSWAPIWCVGPCENRRRDAPCSATHALP